MKDTSLRSKRFRGAENGVFGILPAQKMGREEKWEGGGGGGERRKRLQTNPLSLKTSV